MTETTRTSPPPAHRCEVRVRYADTDAAGVVYHANYLQYFEIGRAELMRDWVCSYSEIERRGLVLPVIECWSRFKAPAFYDDLLQIETSVGDCDQLKCRFNYRVSRLADNRATLLAKGYTIHAATTREGRLTRLPKDILEKIAPYCAL